jgi:N12 class adenine-specific DNA methylase
MTNPWEQDWSGAAPQANDKAPWEQDWGKPSDVTKGGVLDTVRDYTLAGLSKAGQGSMQAIAGMADTVSAPVAKTRAMLTGAAALADRWLPGDINPTLQELAQDDAAAAEAKAQQNALNNPLARGTMALRDAARERGQMLQDFDKEFNPELVRQEGEMSKAQGFWENAKAIKDNPLAFYGNLMQSAPAMATGIGMSSGAARAAGALGKVAGMSDEAALALATRSAGAVGTASEAALSGSQAREGIRSNILATPHAQLAENSPRYQELMSQPGMTPALARDTLANEVSTSASLLTSAATALGSTVTNRVFGNLEAQMIAGNKLGAKDALLKMPAKETAEESAQGMGEDYVQHRAMLPADKTNAYDPGGSFVQNAAAGLAMSGPGSVGGYARQQYNASRGLNPDGTKPATPPAAPPADVAMDIRFPDGTVSKDPAGGAFDYARYDQYRTALESGGRADAKNPNSSATGLHQFTEGTWLAMVEKAKPAWAEGLSRDQILAARTDAGKSTEMVRVLDSENSARLRAAGQPVNEHTLYAAHHFGSGRAIDFAKAGDDALMSNILSPSQMRANPYLEGLTKAQAIANWDSRAGGAAPAASPATKPAAESDIASTETDAAAEALQPREAADVDKVSALDKQAQALQSRWNDLNKPEYGPAFDTERADLQSQIAALRGERDQLARDWPKPEYGHPTSFATESGVRLDGRYALVDADALVTSHNSLLNKNGAYPQELQPRERDRAASEAQISGIVNKLDPARLGMSADAATGAPIIGADGVVESGNARTIALMRAYEANGQKAAEYRQFLSDNANQFGLSAEQVGALKNPVLVRVRDTPVDRAEFARQANASTVAAMSPSEQARSDAQRIDNMEDLTPNDDGDFATSRDFIRRFMARLPMTEQAGMVDSSGALSTAGYARVRNAVLAKAYGDSPVLQRLTESMDDNLRNISKALVMAAPEVAKMRSAIDAGARFDVDITPDLMAAVTELSRLKDAGTSVQDAIAQVGMFGEYSTEVRDLLQFLADNIRRPRRIADFVRAYYAALDQAGDPNQGSLLGEKQPPAKGDLMTAARQDAQGELLDGNPATATRSAADAAGDQGRAQAGPEGRVQRPDEARRGHGDQVDGPARSEAAVDKQPSPTGQWRTFPPDMGSLGIPRAEMPQIKGEHRGAFIQFLKGRGIEASEQHEVDAAKLKPTQAEFSMAKVEGFLKKGLGSGRSVLVSSDGYVLDGHHQWMAHAVANQDIPVITLNAPMRELLAVAHEFPSVQRSEGAANDPNASRREAVQDFKAAMADLADIATKWQRAALVPEKDADLMPVLARLFDAAIRIVGTDLKAATRWVKDQLRANPATKKLVNKVEPMSFRKAAEQALEAMSEPPAQGGLFDSPEQASEAVQGDMFGLPEARPYAQLSADEKAAFDRRQGIRASDRGRVSAANYDTARDNYSPPAVESFMPKEALAAADKVIAEHQPEKRNDAAPALSVEDRARAESLLAPVLAKAAEAKAEFDQKVIDIAQRVGALGQQLAPLKGLKRGAEKLVEEKFDVGGMKDLLRSTIVVRSYADAQAVVDAIESEFKLLRAPKNRTGDVPLRAQGEDVAPEDPAKYAGYSDIMVNVVMPNGTIAEIQINTPDMLAAKGAQGHKLYEVLRAEPKGSATFDVVNAASLAFYAEARAAARNSSSVMRDQSAGQNPLAGLSPSQGAFSSSQNRLPSGNSTYDRSMPSPSARSMPKTQPGGNLSGTFMGSSDASIVPGQGAGRSATSAAAQQSQAQNRASRNNSQNDLFGAQDASAEGNRPPGDAGAGAAAVPATGAQRQAGQLREGAGGRAERGNPRRGDAADDGARHAGAARSGAAQAGRGAGSGAHRNRARADGVPVSRDIPAKSGRNYSFSGPDDLSYTGSWAKKAEANVAAVELLRDLIADKRQATPDEQAVLAKFVGWGASELANNLFGDKLNAPAQALREYESASKEMDKLGRGSLSKGGQYRGQYADPGYYQAVGVLRAAGKVAPHEFPPSVTRAQLDAAKPDAGVQRWIALRDRLKVAMTPTEWKEAARTTQYGHYTSKAVVQSMWAAMQRMGFKGGAVLEPGAGIGVFPGLMPADVAANSTYTGIEYDTFTGNVLKQLMPDERIVIDGYQNVALPKDFYDVAIGNPPFASMSVLNDNEYKRNAFKLHDYFFAKTIDRVKPGGLMAFVTSRYTMDKLDDKARAYLAERADLVGAIRMPQTAFKQNAGTEVVTDVLFLRKKVPGEVFEHAQPWAKSTPMQVDGESYPVNEYFHAHPEMVLGTHSSRGSMRAANEYTVLPGEGDIEAAFAKAAATLPADVYRAEIGSAAQAAQVREIDFNPTAKKEGNFYVTDKGVLMQREGGAGLRVEGLKPADEAIVKAYVPLRDAVKQAQYDQLNGGPWEQSLAALQAAYKAFTDKHGPLLQAKAYTVTTTETDPETGEAVKVKDTRYRHPLEALLRSDPDAYLTLALERFNEETGQITTTDALTKRVLEAPVHARVETVHDALLTSLNDLGRVDIAAVAHAVGLSQKDAIEAMGTAIYQDPSAGWQMADEYLSGNVKKKLAEARAAAQSDARYERNVAALEAAQPAPKTPADINVGLGMNWVPAPFYEQFLHDLAGTTVRVNFNTATREWSVEKVDGHKTPAAIADWGTGDRDIADLLVHALKGTPIDISRTEIADGSKKTVKDHAATEAANEKLKALRERFEGWVWENPERSDKLVQLYNDKFNTTVPRRFDGRHLTLPGTTSTVTVFDHVKRGAWRIIQSGNTYLAHAVGSGKTWQMVISAMEQKRLGLIKKPMFVVPNHMLQQFASEWMQLYPAARLMVADEENFHTNNRRRFVSRVALSDLDGVIITQSAFKILDLAPEFKAKIIQEQLDQLEASLHDADPSLKPGQKSRDPTVKQIQAKIEKLETRLQAAMSSEGKDKNVMFDELGVDMLYVDEAHGYRKLDYATSRKVKGLSSDGSAMALDMYAKVRYLAEKNPKRNLVMASGTPITNTIAELYSLQRFMAPEGLEERGLTDFDSWAAQYGREVTALEAGADGKYSPVTRFQRFVNVGDLTMAFRQFADVLTADDLAAILGDKRPKVNTGARQLLLTPKTDGYHEYQKVLAERTEASRKWRPSKDEPNNPDPIIAIIGDGRLAAIDTRFVTPGAGNDPQSKLNQMIDKLVERYKETAVNTYIDKKTGQPEPLKGGTMMVFSDIGFGDGVRLNRGFDTRAWVNKRLAEAGVDMKQVAYMSDYKASADKLKLFRDVNAGKIRILFGTSKNMGTGVNAQQRLTTIFHLDPTWYPADIEQREGRAVRQGNKNPSVDLYAFATKGTYDQNMWQMIARKAAFIDQIMTGDGSINEVEDVDSESNYSVLAAMVADDPRVLELAGQENEVKRLERLYQAHETQRQSFIDRYRQAEWAVQGAEKSLPAAEAAAKKARDLSGDNFTAKVGKATITERAKFGEALIGQLNELSGRVVTEPTPVGEIGGMPLVFHGSKVGSAFSAWIELQAGEPMNLVSNPGESPAGIAMRAQNAVAAVARRPDKLRERIAEQKAVMESIKDRRQAPFPMAQMLTDARAQVQSLKATLAAEGAAQAEPAANVPTMSRGVAEQDGAGVKLADVQAMADRVAAALPKLPGVEVLQSTQDAPPALLAYLEQQGAMDDTEGAFHDGSIYLFAGNLASMERAEHVLATHEAGHAGLAAILGADRARVMQSLLNLNDDLNRRANAVAKRLKVPVTTAVEELLVDVPPADLVKLKGWRRVAHKVQQWLARSGFTALAARMGRWLESRLSDQQKADLLAAELMTAAREHLAGRKPAVRSMAADAQQQSRWLNKQAAQRGYENADAMALADFDGLESLMAQWRGKNPAAAMLARRIVRDGYRTVNDSVIPETPEYDGNLTGDLAQVPAGKTVKAGPIRLPVGVAEGAHRGLGIEHMADNTRRDATRMPKKQTGDLAEDLVRQAVEVLRGVKEVHYDGSKFIFPNPLMKQAVVAVWRGDHYSITTVRPYRNAQNLWGNPEKVGRLTFPTRDAEATSPSIAVAKESSLHPDRFGLEVASERFDFNTDKPKPATQVVVKKKRSIQVPDGAPRLSRAGALPSAAAGQQAQLTPADRAEVLIQKSARTAQPLDAVAQAITRATGVEWAAKKVGSVIAGALNRYTPESVKAGLVSDYGLDPRVRDERVLMQARQQVQLRKAGEMIDSLASLTREESAAAYRWMNETDPDKIIRGMDELPEGSAEKLQEIQRVIDKLSQEAVDLGQLDQRSYERNKFAYLHRSYAKHVLEPKGAKAARARTVAILGNQYKGRGTTETVAMSMVRQTAPEWWDVARKAGKADPNLIGKKLTRYDRLAPSGAGTQTLPGMDGRSDGRVLETVYLPADRAAPKQYAEWRKGATFEVRDVKRGDLTLWRDWTADERQKMGEIDEARFAIAKTLHGMIRDVEVGRFLGWLSRTQAKPTEAQLPAGASIVDASESLLRAFKPGEWVKVPETTIAGTAVKKYGELAGKYVEGPVWNEVRQALHTAQGFGKVYGAILNAWKLSKTALSPTVHMNNIMSNFVMADWHDVTAGHVAKALRIIMGAHDSTSVQGIIGLAGKGMKAAAGMADQDAARELVKRYKDSGAELGSFVVNETMKAQVDPLLAAMEAELRADPNSTAAQVGVMSALQLLRQGEVGAAAKAAAGAQGVRQVIREGGNMIDLYQSEDSVFRLASWLKAKEEGKTDIEAGRIARHSFMDYNINAPWVQAARKTVLPFISYTYRAAPMLADIAMNKPHKILKLMAVAGAIDLLGSLLAGGGADDDKVRKLLPKEKAGGVWGMVPKLIRMPWNDNNGSPVFLDIRRWVPMGDVFDLGQGHAALPIPPSLMPGGPLALAGELIANKSQFTGKPIVLETDTAGQKAGKVADFVYKWAAPNVLGLPGSYATTGVIDAAKGRTDAFGRERSVAQAIASSIGVKAASYPRDILERNIILESKGKQAELERGMRQLARQRSTNAISDAEFERAIGVEQGKLRKLREETQERLEAGRTH